MFKKLKDKIAEEVKSSPQRIQQLTQTVTEKIQNATSDESFFSIGEDDSSTPEPGFSNVSLSNPSTPQSGHVRKNSNSSIASDISFLPRYESATNLYHLQSDLDISASEIEDNVSTSSQLGHLSKEQIHAAFQKAQMRYHKYRGRYTDIKNYYKELEKENGKIKQVLVETQDKALRRVAELREQCSLEQKAKAHLENALRLEIDEKQYVIDTLKTKVNLLRDKNSNTEKSEALLNLDDGKETLTNDLKAAQNEIEVLNARLQEMKANAIVFSSKEGDLKKKIADLEETAKKKALEMDEVVERERENNLIIAQTKMELHTEIQNRDLEIQNLKHDLDVLKTDLDSYENKNKSTKLENLHSQNAKLIEKIDSLTQKCKGYESELLKLEQLKIENGILKTNDAEMKEEVLRLKKEVEQQQAKFDEEIGAYREDTKKNLLSLESKIREKYEAERNECELHLRNDFEEKLRQVGANTETSQELRLNLLQKEDEIKELSRTVKEFEMRIKTLNDKHVELEKNHLDLIEENTMALSKLENSRKRLDELEIEVPKQRDGENRLTEEICRMQTEISSLQNENLKLSAGTIDLEEELENSTSKNLLLEAANLKYKNELEKLQTEFKDEQSRTELEIKNLANALTTAEGLQKEIVQLHQLAQSPTNAHQTKFQNAIVNDLCITISSVANFQDQVKHLTERNAVLEQELKQSNKDEELTKAKFQKKIKEEKAKFHTDIQNLNAEVSAFKEKNEQIQLYIDEYKQKLNEYETASSQKTVQLQDLTSENAHCKDLLQKLEENITVLSREKDNLSLTLRQKEEEITNLNDKLDRLINENEKLISSQNEIAEENGKLREELETVKSDLNTLKYEDLIRLQSSEAEHQKQISNLQDDHMIALQQEIAKFKTSETNYIEEKGKLTHENLELLNINSELKLEIGRYEVAKLELEKKLHKLEDDSKDLSKSNNELNEQLAKCESDLEALLVEKGEIKENCSTLLGRVEDLQNANQQLQEDLRKLKQEEMSLNEKLVTHSQTSENYSRSLEEIAELKCRNNQLANDFQQILQENDNLVQDLAKIKLQYETISLEKEKWESNELEKSTRESRELETLKIDNKKLQSELQHFEEERAELKTQLRDAECQFTNLTHEHQLLQDEIQELKISPINTEGVEKIQKEHEKEINHLNDKLIQYKSLDLTNRTSIQFYENELQKMKNKNEKLNRKLDETLVTLNHCTDLTTSTETEYLRNVLYNYMLGKEGLVLARVIAAVCKFDDDQTEAILQREQQKQTLLGQLGFR